MQELTRRDFLRAGGVLALGAGLAACSKGTPKPTANPRSLQGIIAGRAQNATVVSAAGETLAGPNERFPFALFVPKTTNDRYLGGAFQVWLATDQTSDALGPFQATYHGLHLGDRGLYSARINVPKDGSWLVLVDGRAGSGGPVLGGTTIAVGRQNPQPIAGEKAIVVASPTFANARGVKPICTSKPFCSMHDISLDTALKNGKPTVLIIGTPRFCQSKTCGPMVDIVDEIKKKTSGVNFVHVEVYADDQDAPATQKLAPAAAAWKLEEEPAVYFINPNLVIAERFVGAADFQEITEQVQALRA